MILWTVMPLDLVLLTEEHKPTYEEITYDDINLQVERTAEHEYRIVRLISTEPSHYLRQDLQPGSLLSYKPVKL